VRWSNLKDEDDVAGLRVRMLVRHAVESDFLSIFHALFDDHVEDLAPFLP
jgi:hypothetical protein